MAWLASDLARLCDGLQLPADTLTGSLAALLAIYALSSLLNAGIPDSGRRQRSAAHDPATLLREVRARRIPDYAITNFSREKFPVARARFPFLDGFRLAIVSGDEGLVKPDAAIYELFLRRAGLSAEACVFIDDSLANVEGARAVGMHAIHFRDPVALRAELRALGFDL